MYAWMYICTYTLYKYTYAHTHTYCNVNDNDNKLHVQTKSNEMCQKFINSNNINNKYYNARAKEIALKISWLLACNHL